MKYINNKNFMVAMAMISSTRKVVLISSMGIQGATPSSVVMAMTA